MARLDRISLDAATYPFGALIPTRYDDLDEQGHVNNAAAVVLLQEGRVRFSQSLGLRNLMPGLRIMVASTLIEYAAELRHPQSVELRCGIGRVGRTSFSIFQLARQDGRTSIYAESTLVIANGAGPVAMPDAVRQRMHLATVA
uniref:acyl-CoA thioesterase n=1 Tax=uncultured Sphingomonas sp. TaxID=158754 RepID=UPI0035CA924B